MQQLQPIVNLTPKFNYLFPTYSIMPLDMKNAAKMKRKKLGMNVHMVYQLNNKPQTSIKLKVSATKPKKTSTSEQAKKDSEWEWNMPFFFTDFFYSFAGLAIACSNFSN